MNTRPRSSSARTIAWSLSLLLLACVMGAPASAYPWYDPWDTSMGVCHENGPYSIASSINGTTLSLNRGESYTLTITGTGPSCMVRFDLQALDNRHFTVSPTHHDIPDGSWFDLDPVPDSVVVNYTLDVPDMDGTFKVIIYVRSPPGYVEGMPLMAWLEFTINVGGGGWVFPGWDRVFSRLFNHRSFIFGLAIVALMAAGSFLVEKSKVTFTRLHGRLALGGMVLVLLASVLGVMELFMPSFSGTWLAWFHAGAGLAGLSTGIVALMTGIKGTMHKPAGIFAVACWTYCLVSGILTWGVVLPW